MTAIAAFAAPSSVLPMSFASMQVDSSDARKRRREILVSQRIASEDGNLSSSSTSSREESCPAIKKRKVVVSSSDDETVVEDPMSVKNSSKTKKPQMKYDPNIPMTKEEATAWRREERRKRNRESAAASRQRQRDRIEELESERNYWKRQFEAVQVKILAFQEQDPHLHPVEAIAEPEPTTNLEITRPETPQPVMSITFSPRASPTTSTFLDLAGEGDMKLSHVELQQPKPFKMISRQA